MMRLWELLCCYYSLEDDSNLAIIRAIGDCFHQLVFDT